MKLFWNAAEHRLRAGWRILLQATIVFLLTFGGMLGFDTALAERGLLTRVLARTSITLLVTALGIWAGARLLDRRRITGYGLRVDRMWWADFGAGLALGILLMALIFAVEWSAGWLTVAGTFTTGREPTPFGLALLAALLYYAGVGINEEVLIRGYGLRNLAEGLNYPHLGARRALLLAWLLSSLAFGLLHLGNAHVTALSIVNLILFGLLFGLPFILTGRLGLSIGLHSAWNFAQGNIFGFPVSGGRSQMTVLATAEQGPDLWTGGAFGPEGGLLGVAAMLLGCLLVLLWAGRGARQTTLYLPLAHYAPRSDKATPSVDRPAPRLAQL